MIEIEHLSKSFDSNKIIDSFDLQISSEIFGLLGPNGAGKTTTIKMITGLLRPDEGKVRLEGQDIQKNPLSAKKQFGLVMEEPFLFSRLTPCEFLSLIGGLYGMARTKIEDRISYLFNLFELEPHGSKLISSLSHGSRQKVALCGALIHSPSNLILDEPFSGLDPQSVYTFKHELKHFVQQGGTVLIATHILEVAQSLCDRVGILNHGKLIACGDLTQLQKEASLSSNRLEGIFLKLINTAMNDTAVIDSN